MLEQAESESPTLTKKGRPRKKMGPQSDEARQTMSQRGRNSKQSQIIQDVGVLLPGCPTTAQELVNAWEVAGNDDARAHGVLIFRQKEGINERELIARVPMMDYQLADVAKRYGPGLYYLKGTAGRYEKRTGKFIVSESYAADCGFGRLPEPPKPADLQAVRTLERAAQGNPVDPLDLTAAIVRASEETTRRILDQYGLRPGGPGATPAGPTFQGMESQFQQVEKMYGFMERMEARAMESVERRMGLAPTVKPDEADPNSWAGILQALAPVGVELARNLMSRGQAPAPVVPLQIRQPEPQTIQPEENMLRIEVPQEILDRIAPAVGMLAPFKSMLLRLDNPEKSIQDTAEALGSFIPPACYDALVTLADYAEAHGPEILRVIGPAFVTPRWAAILAFIAAEIKKSDAE